MSRGYTDQQAEEAGVQWNNDQTIHPLFGWKGLGEYNIFCCKKMGNVYLCDYNKTISAKSTIYKPQLDNIMDSPCYHHTDEIFVNIPPIGKYKVNRAGPAH